MADTATVDPRQLHCIFGIHRIRGMAKGQALSADYLADGFAVLEGLDGEGFYVKNLGEAATIAVTLLQSSDSNDVLSAHYNLDRQTPGGILVPLLIKDGGRTVYQATGCRIARLAPSAWSDTGETRTWQIITTKLRGFVGGIGATPVQTS